jgi:hypothetical protein
MHASENTAIAACSDEAFVTNDIENYGSGAARRNSITIGLTTSGRSRWGT